MAESQIDFKVTAALSAAVLERGDLLVVSFNRPMDDQEYTEATANLQRLVDDWGIRVFVIEGAQVVGVKGPALDENGAPLDG